MSQLEKSSNKIISFLRRKPPFEGQIVHRSDQGVIHEQIQMDRKRRTEPVLQFVRKGESNTRNLRILEKTEIEDLGKVYQEIKINFNIKADHNLDRIHIETDDFDKYINCVYNSSQEVLMDTTQNTSKILEMYFKKREEKKLNKVNYTIQKMVKRKIESESPQLTHKSLVNKKLFEFVRTKNRLSYESNNQHIYRGEMDRSFFDTNHARTGNSVKLRLNKPEQIDTNSGYQRQSIISLETGLPTRPYIQLSSFREKIELREQLFDPNKKQIVTGVTRKHQKTYSVNLPNGRSFTPNGTSIVSTLNEYFELAEDEQKKIHFKKKQTSQIIMDPLNKSSQFEKYALLRSKVECNEISLVGCCEGFLNTKRSKNCEFMNLIETANRDRPLTQQIRLRLYTAKASERQRLTQLRKSAEKQRQHQVQSNTSQHQWYETIVEQITRVRDEHESLSVCDHVFDAFKNILEDGSMITKAHIYQLVESIDRDDELILNNIAVFMLKIVAEYFYINFQDFRKFSKFRKFFTTLQKENLSDRERATSKF